MPSSATPTAAAAPSSATPTAAAAPDERAPLLAPRDPAKGAAGAPAGGGSVNDDAATGRDDGDTGSGGDTGGGPDAPPPSKKGFKEQVKSSLKPFISVYEGGKSAVKDDLDDMLAKDLENTWENIKWSLNYFRPKGGEKTDGNWHALHRSQRKGTPKEDAFYGTYTKKEEANEANREPYYKNMLGYAKHAAIKGLRGLAAAFTTVSTDPRKNNNAFTQFVGQAACRATQTPTNPILRWLWLLPEEDHAHDQTDNWRGFLGRGLRRFIRGIWVFVKEVFLKALLWYIVIRGLIAGVIVPTLLAVVTPIRLLLKTALNGISTLVKEFIIPGFEKLKNLKHLLSLPQKIAAITGGLLGAGAGATGGVFLALAVLSLVVPGGPGIVVFIGVAASFAVPAMLGGLGLMANVFHGITARIEALVKGDSALPENSRSGIALAEGSAVALGAAGAGVAGGMVVGPLAVTGIFLFASSLPVTAVPAAMLIGAIVGAVVCAGLGAALVKGISALIKAVTGKRGGDAPGPDGDEADADSVDDGLGNGSGDEATTATTPGGSPTVAHSSSTSSSVTGALGALGGGDKPGDGDSSSTALGNAGSTPSGAAAAPVPIPVVAPTGDATPPAGGVTPPAGGVTPPAGDVTPPNSP
jgi:hypothetical protein